MGPVKIAAVYTFAAHYHSGQFSRGYRLLCRAGVAWERRAGIEPRLGYWETLIAAGDNPVAELYEKLAERYGGEV